MKNMLCTVESFVYVLCGDLLLRNPILYSILYWYFSLSLPPANDIEKRVDSKNQINVVINYKGFKHL